MNPYTSDSFSKYKYGSLYYDISVQFHNFQQVFNYNYGFKNEKNLCSLLVGNSSAVLLWQKQLHLPSLL